MGEVANADPAVIPDFAASMDPQKRFVGKDYLLAKAHNQLETDNIMDLSHIEYLGPTSLPLLFPIEESSLVLDL